MNSRRIPSDWPLAAFAFALTAFGVLMVYSAGQTDVPNFVERIWRAQLVWVGLGVAVAYAISRTSVRLVEWASLPVYVGALVLLVLLLFIGTGAGTAASTKSWLAIGGVRLGQPSELAKIAVVLMLARVLSAQRQAPTSLFALWRPALIVGVPWLLIMAQPDLGTGLVFLGVFFAMLFWSGVSWPLLVMAASPAVSLVLAFGVGAWGAWFLLLLALVAWQRPHWLEGAVLVGSNFVMGVVAPLLWERLNPYQQRRLLVFLDPSSDPRASGYQMIQSQVAIGSGGLLRQGIHRRVAEATCLPAGAVHRLHLRRGRRGTGLHRRYARARSALRADAAHGAGGGPSEFSLCVARGLRADRRVVHPRAGQCGNDHRVDADHRDPAALLLLRGIVHAGLLDGSRAAGAHLG